MPQTVAAGDQTVDPPRTGRVPLHPQLRDLGHAWLALTIVLASHVADEALTDFLAVYNPIVRAARERLGWFPMPTFEFGPWLTGLAVGVALLLLLVPLAYRRAPAVRMAAYPYAAIMFLNGLGHLGGSLYFGRWMPGATTAPLLLAASSWLFIAARSAGREGERALAIQAFSGRM